LSSAYDLTMFFKAFIAREERREFVIEGINGL